MEHRTRGSWAALFDRPMSFQDEIGVAVDLGSTWSIPRFGDQADVTIEAPAGFCEPAWATDKDFLYLRRPEGVWRVRKDAAAEGRPLRLGAFAGKGIATRSLVLPTPPERTDGWLFRGVELSSASEIDRYVSPVGRGASVDAEEVGWPLLNVVEGAAGATTVLAGDCFGHSRLGFATSGNWLVARDISNGRRVAWDLGANKAAREALALGRLCLRFQGTWAEDVDVHVVMASHQKSG